MKLFRIQINSKFDFDCYYLKWSKAFYIIFCQFYYLRPRVRKSINLPPFNTTNSGIKNSYYHHQNYYQGINIDFVTPLALGVGIVGFSTVIWDQIEKPNTFINFLDVKKQVRFGLF